MVQRVTSEAFIGDRASRSVWMCLLIPVSMLLAGWQSNAELTAAQPSSAKSREDTQAALQWLETSAEATIVARHAVELYDAYEPKPAAGTKERRLFDERLDHWRQLAEQQAWREGAEWIPAETLKENRRQAQMILDESIEVWNEQIDSDYFLKDQQRDQFLQNLRRAMNLDSSHIEIPYLLGLIHSTRSFRTRNVFENPEAAKKYFLRVLGVAPEHFGALNNLGVSEIKLGDLKSAMLRWERCIQIDPDRVEPTQNLGRMLHGIQNQVLRNDSILVLKRTADLYQSMAELENHVVFSAGTGWLLTPLVRRAATSVDTARIEAESDNTQLTTRTHTLVPIGSGILVGQLAALSDSRQRIANAFWWDQGEGQQTPVGLVDVFPGIDEQLMYLRTTDDVEPEMPLSLSIPTPGTQAYIVARHFDRLDGDWQRVDETTMIPVTVSRVRRHGTVSFVMLSTSDAIRIPGGCPVTVDGQSLIGITTTIRRPIRNETGMVTAVLSSVIAGRVSRVAPDVELEVNFETPQAPQLPDGQALESIKPLPRLRTGYVTASSIIRGGQVDSARRADLWEDRTCAICTGNSSVDCPHCVGGRYVTKGKNDPVAPGTRRRVIPCPYCQGSGLLRCGRCEVGITPIDREW